MTKQIINIGGQSNDGTGDSIRDAFDKVNLNFTEIYSGGAISGGISNIISAYTNGYLYTLSTETVIQTASIISNGTSIVIWTGFHVVIQKDPIGSDVIVTFNLKRDDQILQTFSITANDDNLYVDGTQQFAPFIDDQPAGVYVYTITAVASAVSLLTAVSNRGLVLLEVKK